MEELNVELETESVINESNTEIISEDITTCAEEITESNTESLVEVNTSDTQDNNDIELLTSINTYITIICIVVVVWFCAWSMRSWRYFTSKIGRRL